MSKSVKPKDEPMMQITQKKWEEEVASKEALEKKVKNYLEERTVLHEKINGLEQALAAVTEFNKASELTSGDKAELKMAREAYKSFSFVYQDETWWFDFMVDPLVKKVHLLGYKRVK